MKLKVGEGGGGGGGVCVWGGCFTFVQAAREANRKRASIIVKVTCDV